MDFIKEWGRIAGFAGLALGVFLVLLRELISKVIFSTLTKKQSYKVTIIFMIMICSISLVSIFLYYHGRQNDAYQITVLAHGENGKDDLVLATRGKVKAIYGDANVIETTNDKGEVTFKQIPTEFFDSERTIELVFIDPMGEPYRALKPDSLYHLTKNKYISLIVKLYGLNQISGIVTDSKTSDPIPDVRISILGAETISNQYGEYLLSIPKEYQHKFQTVRASNKGYESFELNNVPIQTQKEFPIVMKPKSK